MWGGAYALRYAVMVRDGGVGAWGFWATSRSYQGAWKRLAEAHRRGGFDGSNSTIVEGVDCAFCAPDEPCAVHVEGNV